MSDDTPTSADRHLFMTATSKLKFLLHPGFYKTATTTLQNAFFAEHPQILNVGKPYADPKMLSFMHSFLYDDELAYDYANGRDELARLRAQWEAQAKKPGSPIRAVVLSEEDLIHSNTIDRMVAARRLADMFADAEVLITIRNQLTLVESMYIYNARGYAKPKPYKVWIADDIKNRHRFLRTIRYSEIIAAYEQLFGRDRVHILMYENLAKDPEAFFKSLCVLLGIDALPTIRTHANRRPTNLGFRYRSLRKRFLWNVPLGKFLPGPIQRGFRAALERSAAYAPPVLPADLTEYLADYYRQDNRQLAASHDLPLAEYGYPT